ncbi:MAG: hypothetical protein HYX63_03385 [Gammaproteobacteria bacterium]|nr:hypothetical protein [Gammaproteobacteria bacterium]
MQLRPDIILTSTIKSLSDVVAPAVDPHNKLAQEQIQIAIGLLRMLARRLPLEFRFDCDELKRLLGFAADLQRHANDAATCAPLADLALAANEGAEILRRAQADPRDVQNAVQRLRASSGTAVDVLYREESPIAKAAVKTLVLAHAAEQLLRDRAWVSAQGWEPHPEAVPPLEDLL